jgi:streptogramin lyase
MQFVSKAARRRPRKAESHDRVPRFECLEDRQLLAFTALESSLSLPAGSIPRDITTGPDGNLWFTEAGTSRIGHATPGGALLPEVVLPAGSGPLDITTGPDGNLWFSEMTTSKIGRVTPAGILLPEISLPAGSGPASITTGPDGNVWFVEFGTSKVGRATPDGTLLAEISLPPGSSPKAIVTGPDRNLWVTEGSTSKLARITAGGALLPEISLTAGSSPFGITNGPDGNLWFAELGTSKVGHVTTAGVVLPEVALTSGSVPFRIVSAPDGNLYVTEGAGKIARITPAGVLAEVSFPGGGLFGVTVGPDGNVLFTDQGNNKLGEAITINFLTGALDTASDTGPSSTDGITADALPSFHGRTKGHATVTISAQGLTHFTTPTAIASAPAAADGTWHLAPLTALPDDSYQFTVVSTDAVGGATTAPVALTSPAHPLVITTRGPVITGVTYMRSTGQVIIDLEDSIGLDMATLTRISNYAAPGVRTRGGPVTIASASATLSDTTAHVVVTLGGLGKQGPPRIKFIALAGGIADRAGNALDGAFSGTLPTGDGHPGGNFVARLPLPRRKHRH